MLYSNIVQTCELILKRTLHNHNINIHGEGEGGGGRKGGRDLEGILCRGGKELKKKLNGTAQLLQPRTAPRILACQEKHLLQQYTSLKVRLYPQHDFTNDYQTSTLNNLCYHCNCDFSYSDLKMRMTFMVGKKNSNHLVTCKHQS